MGCNCNKDKEKRHINNNTEPRKPYNVINVITDEILGRAEKLDKRSVDERLVFCNECEKLFRPTRQCKKCGCFVDIKAKYAKSFCPLGKW